MAKILIVEDDEKIMKLFKIVVETMGHETLLAVNGEEAVRMAKENLPDLVLMDLHMPVMDGIKAFKILQSDEKTKNIPVIAVTAYLTRENIEHYLSLNFADCLQKPVGKDFLIEAVSKALIKKQE